MNLRYRPMALMGFSMLFVFLACVYISSKIAVLSIAMGLVLFVISLAFEKIRRTVVTFFLSASLILSGTVFVASQAYNISEFKKYYEKECVISGDIVEEPDYSYSRYHYIIETKSINNDQIKTKVKVSVHSKIDAEIFDYVSLKAKVYPIGSENNDLRLYYQSKGIYLGAYNYDVNKNILIEPCEKKPLQYKFIQARKTIKNNIIDKLPNDYGGIIVGMLIGNKDYVSDKTLSNIKEAGIAPLFAVSGLHFSIWVMGLFSILEMLKVNKRLNSAINIIFSFGFMALTGFSPSVTRAGIMLIILLFGNLLFRKSDSVNSLGFAVLLICLINPLIVSNLGFLLSVSATLGIILIYPIFNRNIISNLNHNILEKILATVTSIFFVSVCAIIGTFPITVLMIGYFSIFTVISNLLVTLPATVCMVFGGVSALFYPFSFISTPSVFIAGLLSKFIYYVIETIASFKATTISTDNIYWQVGTVCFIICLVFIYTFLKNKAATKAACVSLCGVIIISSCCYFFMHDDTVHFNILDEDSSLGIVIEENGHKYVILGKADFDFLKSDIHRRLSENGSKNNDLLLLLDDESPFRYQTLSLINDSGFKRIVSPVYNSMMSESIKHETDITINNIINIELNDLNSIKYIYNNDYIVAKCIFDKVSILIVYESDGLTDLPDEFVSADILIFRNKLPKNIDINSFGETIISSDEKSLEDVTNQVDDINIPVLSTAYNGDIDIEIKDNDYKLAAEVV